MKKLHFFLAFLLCASTQNSFAQVNALESKYGMRVEYTYSLLEKLKKNDKYFLSTTVINNSGKDLYYAKEPTSTTEHENFVIVKAENAKGLFNSDGTDTKGELTKYQTMTGGQIYKIKAGGIFKMETKIQVPKGTNPVMTVKYPNELKELRDMNVNYMTAGFVDGVWVSDCGKFQFNLSLAKLGGDTIQITQAVNGRSFVYEYKGGYFFQRRDNYYFTLNYAKDGSAFFYTSEDGVSCTWKRKEEQ